jgi:hypothetical protein
MATADEKGYVKRFSPSKAAVAMLVVQASTIGILVLFDPTGILAGIGMAGNDPSRPLSVNVIMFTLLIPLKLIGYIFGDNILIICDIYVLLLYIINYIILLIIDYVYLKLRP